MCTQRVQVPSIEASGPKYHQGYIFGTRDLKYGVCGPLWAEIGVYVQVGSKYHRSPYSEPKARIQESRFILLSSLEPLGIGSHHIYSHIMSFPQQSSPKPDTSLMYRQPTRPCPSLFRPVRTSYGCIYRLGCPFCGFPSNARLLFRNPQQTPNKPLVYPEGPGTQYLSSLVPNTSRGTVWGTRNLKYWILGPSGLNTFGVLDWP